MSTYVKTSGILFQPWTVVSGGFINKTTEVQCPGDIGITYYLDVGLMTGSTPVGTKFTFEANTNQSSDWGWRMMGGGAIITGTVQPTLMDTDADVAGGQTLVACSNSVPALNDIIFFRNFTDITSSEMGTVVARVTTSGSESVTLQDPLTNTVTSNRYFTKAEQYVIPFDLGGVNSWRVSCNNNYAASATNIAYRLHGVKIAGVN